MAKAKAVTGLEAQAPTSKNARLLAQARLEEMYSWSEFVNEPFRIKELHDLRIAAKRLRYSMEIFEDELPQFCKEAVKEVEQIQEELGSLHDSDVMVALLRLCLLKYPQTGRKNHAPSLPLAVGKGYQKGQNRASDFAPGMQDVNADYEQALTEVKQQQVKGYSLLQPELVAALIDPQAAPSAEQRRGLEMLLQEQERLREQQYEEFRRHWRELEERDFRGQLQRALKTK